MAESPWIKWFTSNFLNGVADMDADEIGVYAVMITLMADRGGPIEDDPKWLARRCGTSTRRFNQIRAKLLDLGKLQLRNGMLGNRRMINEVEKRHGKSDQARSAALKRWHTDSEPELPGLDQDQDAAPARARTHGAGTNGANNPAKSGQTSEEQNDLISGKNGHDPQKTASSGDADASPPVRARRSQRIEDRISTRPDSGTPPAPPEPPKPDRLANRDLQRWVDQISEASGHRPISPDALNRAFRIAQEWRDEGFDLDQVVVPTIRNIVAGSSEPTRTFGRFTVPIRHEHARLKAKGELGQRYVAPPSPVLKVEGEEPLMAKIRAELLERLGPTAYCYSANTARFERVTDAAAGRTPLRVIEGSNGSTRLMDGDRSGIVRAIAKRHGFSEVW